MTRKQLVIIALLVVLNAIVLCGGSVFLANGLSITAPTVPTAIQVSSQLSPTYTPTATAMPLPPTPTIVPPSPTPTNPAAGLITTAISKARLATSYRLTMDLSIKGDLRSMAPSSSANQELSMLGISGEVSGKDSHFTLKGLVSVFFTGDASKGMEMIEAGGKSFVRGPLPLLGAKENRWYVLPTQSGSGNKPTAGPSDMLPVFGDASTDLGKFNRSGSETLDKTRCEIYTADKETALKSFSALSSSAQLNQGELSTLQTGLQEAEFSLWICDDGYLHQLRMAFVAQDPNSPSKTISIKLSAHLYDFNTKITIAAPANASPASVPFISTLTPTPRTTPTRTPTPKK